MGYHLIKIEKGILGEFSKIQEEFSELIDANNQNNPILELCELSDLLGAINEYSTKKYNISIEQIYKMTEATIKAFQDGSRK